MTNDRLKAALTSAGLTIAQAAAKLSIDPKTVERWITRGVTPHRGTALQVADLLGRPVGWLWPAMEDAAAAYTAAELVGFFPHRSATPKRLWLELLESATSEITLMAYASLFLPEENPTSIQILRRKAEDGCRVRICLGDQEAPTVALRAVEERLYEGYNGRIQMAMAYYRPLMDVPGVEFHVHGTTLYNSIFKYDDQMLVNQHVYGMYGYLGPILHLRRLPGADLFDMYSRSLDLVWEESYPYRRSAVPGRQDGGDRQVDIGEVG